MMPEAADTVSSRQRRSVTLMHRLRFAPIGALTLKRPDRDAPNTKEVLPLEKLMSFAFRYSANRVFQSMVP